MRFKKIIFENYRCFMNGMLELAESDEKNINLIIGPNGGGKTEMLFAFWWTLYDFDFKKLRGKENTPYALNSDLYKELEQGNVGDEKKCSVILEFEYLNVCYRVKKTTTYRKTEKQIRQESYHEFSHYNDNGELSLPIHDPREIDKKINKILPKAILDGIIFDGERMEKLSSADEKSKEAIKGVINDITNVELIENCILVYKDIRKDLNSSIKRIASQMKHTSLEEIVQKINEDDKIIEENSIEIEQKKERLEVVETRLENISDELKRIDGARQLEIEREQERKNIDSKNKLLDEYYKNFSASLKEAYLINTDDLMDKVEEIIQTIDVPTGLTVEAVRSILSRETCVCGNCLGSKEIEKLNELILSLPPDNINSTLAEVIRQTKDKIKDVKERCKTNYKYITVCEKEIKESKEQIASLSAQILGFDEKEAIDLETENKNLETEKIELKVAIGAMDKELKEADARRETLKVQRDNMGKNNAETNKLNKQLDYVEKCLKAFEELKNKNKERALALINLKLQKAYEKLSEDAVLGNAIYIVQYDETKKYQMVVYIKNKAQKLLNKWKESGEYDKYLNSGLSDEEVRERAILSCADSNSTGQSKMNTLSFAKAILDYSNEQKEENGLEIRKQYPFLIDAPFSDIAGDNLINASSELHDFSCQVVLMLDSEKYESVKSHIKSYVNKIYYLEKNNEKNVTSIKAEE